MKNKGLFKKYSLKQVTLITTLNTCLVFFFAISMLMQQSSAFAAVRLMQKKADQSGLAIAPGQAHQNYSQPIQLPFEPGSSQEEQENDDENESENDYNDDCANAFLKSSTDYSFAVAASVHKTNSFVVAIAKRSTVSLFILHHSWKSFLA